jgi:hypothetical protein
VRVADGAELRQAHQPRRVPSVAQLEGEVQAARGLVYDGSTEAALEGLHRAIEGLERAAPSAGLWPALADARALEAQVLKGLGRKAEAAHALRQILANDEAHALSADYYAPSTMQLFEAVRQSVRREQKLSLTIDSDPPDAEVFLDGRLWGRTPVSLQRPSGRFGLVLVRRGQTSFVRDVQLVGPQAVSVDLAVEGALSIEGLACIEADGGDAQAQAHRLGALLAADEVTVFSIASSPGEPVAFAATLRPVSAATRVSAAVVAGLSVQHLAALVGDGPRPTEPLVSPRSVGLGAGRLLSLGLVAAGVVTAAVAVGIRGTGQAERDRLAALSLVDGRIVPPGDGRHDEARSLLSSVRRSETLVFGLLGVAAGLVVTGALGCWLLPRPWEATLAVVPSPTGPFVVSAGVF